MEIKLPEIGEGVTEGELVRWLVKPGDVVKVDQPIAEVMTDKATVEIPSPHKGKVTVLKAKEGENIPVGGVLLELDADGAGAGAGAAAEKPASSSQTPAQGSKPQAPAQAMKTQTPASTHKPAPQQT